jgi:hypothetical protein
MSLHRAEAALAVSVPTTQTTPPAAMVELVMMSPT